MDGTAPTPLQASVRDMVEQLEELDVGCDLFWFCLFCFDSYFPFSITPGAYAKAEGLANLFIIYAL